MKFYTHTSHIFHSEYRTFINLRQGHLSLLIFLLADYFITARDFFNQSERCSSVFGPAKKIRMTHTAKFSNRRYHFPVFSFFYYFICYLIPSKIKLFWVEKSLIHKFIHMKYTWHDMKFEIELKVEILNSSITTVFR